jgi:flagellar biosynthesis chaperone FliJ
MLDHFPLFDFDSEAISSYGASLSHVNRILYLRRVIRAYKQNTGFSGDIGDKSVGLRMSKQMRQDKFVTLLEQQIEETKKNLEATEHQLDRARYKFVQAQLELTTSCEMLRDYPEELTAMLKSIAELAEDLQKIYGFTTSG